MSKHVYPFTEVEVTESLTRFENWNFNRKYGSYGIYNINNNMNKIEVTEKNRILKEALRIVDKLAKSDLADLDIAIPDSTYEELEALINRARELKRNRFWNLT